MSEAGLKEKDIESFFYDNVNSEDDENCHEENDYNTAMGVDVNNTANIEISILC